MPKLLLGTPTVDGMAHIDWMRAVMDLIAAAPGMELDITLATPKGTLLDTARNALASMVLNDPSYDGVLFIDSDIQFAPETIGKLAAFGEPVTAVLCPAKHVDVDRFAKLVGRMPDPKVAFEASLRYVAEENLIFADHGGRRTLPHRGGFVQVSACGTGLMLVMRPALENIRERFPDLWVPSANSLYRGYGVQDDGGVLQCFSAYRAQDGYFVGEDVAFCMRWHQGCGGEIWALPTDRVAHIGAMRYSGALLTKLRAGDSG